MVFGHPDRQRSSMADAEIDPATIPGVESRHPWRHPWRAWRAIFKRIYVMNGYHNLSLMAAGVAFYAFLSFVPLLGARSEEHTSELQSLMRISYAVFCLKKKKNQ